MINQTILFLPQTDCKDLRFRPFSKQLGNNVNWDPDKQLGLPLNKLFNKVIRYDLGESITKLGILETNNKIIEIVHLHKPKFLIWPTMTYEILEETFQEVRKYGVYVIGWFFDDEIRFEDYSRFWIPCMDYIFTADKFSVIKYQQLGAKAFYLPVTNEPDNFKPTKIDFNNDEVCFVGSKYVADREKLIKDFISNGVKIATHGNGWENGFVSFDNMAQLFFNSKINICFTKSFSGIRNQIKGKIFDITMCGGFLLCEYADGIEDFFELGKEIVCFNNCADAIEKIEYFLIHNEERDQIAKAGQIRAIRDLAQHKLLAKVFSSVEADISCNLPRKIVEIQINEMPPNIRLSHAQFHLRWANAFKQIGIKGKSYKDQINLSLKYFSFFDRLLFMYPKITSIIFLIKKMFKPILNLRTKLRRLLKTFLDTDNSALIDNLRDNEIILERLTNHGLPLFLEYSFDDLKKSTLSYVNSLKVGLSSFDFKYSQSCIASNIYSSAYTCLIYSLFGKLDEITHAEKQQWAEYFNGFQNNEDGLFYDDTLKNDSYNNSDWWGARHLNVHLINVFIALDSRPTSPFNYLKKYYNLSYLKAWLDEQNWDKNFTYDNDIDNKIMNIGCALQYQRDYWNDKAAGDAVSFLQTYLLNKINPDTGMWGYFNLEDKIELSRMVQFAYHLYPIYFYDSIDIENKEKVIDYTLGTQNIYGGFGVNLNSSACEDIDSVYILIRLTEFTNYRKSEINLALKRALIWILSNQNKDGGYVFRRSEAMFYGHDQMYSIKNESAMFPTWFRTLSIAYLSNYLFNTQFKIVKSPGY